MRLTDRFTAQALPEANDVTPVTARLIVDGQASECVLTGAVLEAAVEWEGRFVLFLSDGIDWEEGLNIHLLDTDLSIMDSVSMGWAYTPGVFSGLSLQEPDQLEFSFPSTARWRVHLLTTRQWTVPMPTWLPGVARSGSWWRWIDLVQLCR